MDQDPAIRTRIVKAIRDGSELGRLVRDEDILAELREQGFFESGDVEWKARFAPLLEQVLQENPDLRFIPGRDGVPHYYSLQSLSETYAAILVRKTEGPLWLMAEVVRDNSRLYPRPVPAESFREPPFGLTGAEVAECLTTMREQNEYQDIAQTTTSAGTRFLYSTRYLEPDHASALAEWLDVGHIDNP
ncbi:MAG: hypothetical protein V1792_12740 [Pseudomonadota bacterium]